MFASDGILNWLTVTAQLMIIGTGAALLMIGGEFDLSVGSMIGFTGMVIAIPTIYFHVPDRHQRDPRLRRGDGDRGRSTASSSCARGCRRSS